MIQPTGLAGLRQASTKPTTANGAVTHTGSEPLAAFRFWCASPASGTAAMNKTSTTTPMAAQAAGDASRKRRPVASAAGAPTRSVPPTTPPYDRIVPGTLPPTTAEQHAYRDRTPWHPAPGERSGPLQAEVVTG